LLGFANSALPVRAQESLFDPTFQIGLGADGVVSAILVQRDGSILVGGEFESIGGGTNAYLTRLTSDGKPDPAFQSGIDGPVYRLLELPDGNVLVAGAFTNVQGALRPGLVRWQTNGLVDLTFDAGASFDSGEWVLTICVQPDGKILAATQLTAWWRLVGRIFRFHPDGQLDQSFARPAFDGSVYAMMPLTNGATLVGGNVFVAGDEGRRALALLRENGEPDPALPSLLSSNSTVFSLTALTNGNILVSGALKPDGVNPSGVLAQLTPTWNWEAGFVPDPFGPDFAGPFVRAVLLQPDGKLVVGGEFYEVGGYWRRHLARLDPQGRVDPCFDPGIALGGTRGARALARQGDGRILVGGDFDNRSAGGSAHLARALPQSECDAMRVYFIQDGDCRFALGTCPPGGTNKLQMSTNLLDWQTIETSTGPYLFYLLDWLEPAPPSAFFRAVKEF
jgi:uncharacterized delta-60 repeat protein